MSVRYAVVIGLTAGILLQALPAGADSVADGVAAIPAEVEAIEIAGAWERDDGEQGVYRIVVTRAGTDPITARLFVQWLALDGTALRVDESIEVTEIGDLGGDVVGFRTESDADGLAIYLDMIGASGDLADTYELFMFSPTDYLFGPATN